MCNFRFCFKRRFISRLYSDSLISLEFETPEAKYNLSFLLLNADAISPCPIIMFVDLLTTGRPYTLGLSSLLVCPLLFALSNSPAKLGPARIFEAATQNRICNPWYLASSLCNTVFLFPCFRRAAYIVHWRIRSLYLFCPYESGHTRFFY